jgi:Chaperone of endosialidase
MDRRAVKIMTKTLPPTMQDDKVEKSATQRRSYGRPTLKVYGSVTDFTKGSATVGTDTAAGNSRKNPQSDRRTKENIVRIGDHPLGIGIYLYDYKPEYRDLNGHGRQFGVMADEVETVLPAAVSVHTNGYKQVAYGMMGVFQGEQ